MSINVRRSPVHRNSLTRCSNSDVPELRSQYTRPGIVGTTSCKAPPTSAILLDVVDGVPPLRCLCGVNGDPRRCLSCCATCCCCCCCCCCVGLRRTA